jgi:hypothetical protein
MSRKGEPGAGKRVMVDLQQLDLLEQKVIKATEMIRALRKERDAMVARVREAETTLAAARQTAGEADRERAALLDATEQLDLLREERQSIRGRVDRMLEIMAALDEGAVETRSDH